MKTPNNVAGIKEAIVELEQQQTMQMDALKQNATELYEHLKPVNLLKRTLENTIPIDSVKKTILSNALGLATGYLTQKVLIKNKDTFSGKILSTLVNLLVAHAVTHNADTIKNWGEQLMGYLSKVKNQEESVSRHEEEQRSLQDSSEK